MVAISAPTAVAVTGLVPVLLGAVISSIIFVVTRLLIVTDVLVFRVTVVDAIV